MSSPLVINIEDSTKLNPYYRDVIYTGNFQLVLMSLKPSDTIPLEQHPHLDQFFRIESGTGYIEIFFEDEHLKYPLYDGVSVVVPANTYHQVVNDGTTDLKLYTIYSTPNHPDDTKQLEQPLNKE